MFYGFFRSKDKMENKARVLNQIGSEDPRTDSSIQQVGSGESVDSSGELHPWKIMPVSQRVQFTCEFKQFNISGRLDSKSMKTTLSKIAPGKVVAVRGSEQDCMMLANLAKSCKIQDIFSPSNGESVSFQVMMEKLQLKISSTHIPSNIKTMKTASSGDCTVCLLQGSVAMTGGVLSYTDKVSKDHANDMTGEGGIDNETDGEVFHSSAAPQGLKIQDETVGAISMGEVAFTTLRQQLEAAGIETVPNGAVLICAGQVLIRKEKNNFSIEGPPIPAFFEARKALYQQFVFI